MNKAQQLHHAIGVAVGEVQHKQAHGNEQASATKSGPGRFYVGGKPGNKLAKPHAIRAYRALMAAFAAKRVHKVKHLRDEHGVFTRTGGTYTVEGDGIEPTSRECVLGGGVGGGLPPSYTARRKWLAGISSQRGY